MQRVFRAIRIMRVEGASLTRAARRASTSPRTVRRHAPAVVARPPGSRRYEAAPSDRLPRFMRVQTPDGVVVLPIRNSRTGSRIGRYWNAVDRYLKTGDQRLLLAFRGRAVRTGKLTYPFITDPRTLERLAHAGEVRFEDLYVHTS